MNILHISPYVPSVHASHAGGVCMGKELEALRKKHNVFVLSFINDEKEEKLVEKEFKNDNKSFFVYSNTYTKGLNALTHLNKPIFFGIRSSCKFKKLLLNIVRENSIDVIHAEYTAMGQFVWIKKYFPNIKFNLVEHDVTKQSYDRYCMGSSGIKHVYQKWQSNLVNKNEEDYLKKCDQVFTLNYKDKDLLSKYYGIQNVEVITPYYGIDFDAVQNIHVEKEENSICFVGLMSRSENHEAAMRLIHIIQELPNELIVKLNIIGAYPNDELKSYESSRIHITGFVDSIEEEILKNELAVFPLMHGAGIKFKILLSAGLGLPVITTDIGAEGIDEEGEYVSLVKTDDEFKSEIIKYIDNDDLRKEKAKQVKDYVLDNFNWEKTENLFDMIYR